MDSLAARLGALVLVGVCGFNPVALADTARRPDAVPIPSIAVIPADVGIPPGPANSTPVNLAVFGYTEAEFEVSGTTRTYQPKGSWGADGVWPVTVASSDHPYATRILVRRPTDPAKFNGTVVVEWLNVTSGYDLDVDWPQSYPEFLRDGFAWVGVSAQKIGVDALKKINPPRYGQLAVDSDDQSYDIFSQAAKAVARQSHLVMGGLRVQRLIAAGQSQSAIRLVTYTNAIQPLAKVYDGIMIHSRAAGAAPISRGQPLPSLAYIREDLAIPVLQLQSQTDVGELQSYRVRQPDSAVLRTWEVAGASHVDGNFLTTINAESAATLGAPPVSCIKQVNNLPFRYVENAAWSAFDAWLRSGTPPSVSPQIEVDADGKIQLDSNGNALGGIRLAELEVPVATYTVNNFGRPNTGVPNGLDFLGCSLLGSTEPFARTTLDALYPTHSDYVTKYQQAAHTLVQQGFMLPPDEDLAILRADQSAIGGK